MDEDDDDALMKIILIVDLCFVIIAINLILGENYRIKHLDNATVNDSTNANIIEKKE